jgi:hypothetical protein
MASHVRQSVGLALGGKIEDCWTQKEQVVRAQSSTNGQLTPGTGFKVRPFNQTLQPNPGKTHNMARADAKTAVLADGLRYKSKVSGSPFAATTSFGAATMSCFMCGKHRARSLMGTRKVLGKSQAVCAPSCKELDAILAAQAAGTKA